ncbi:protein of unknown function [Microbacterium sp. Nx66]|nr:protein of unknown function [Microbacterium sp. Nx66]
MNLIVSRYPLVQLPLDDNSRRYEPRNHLSSRAH